MHSEYSKLMALAKAGELRKMSERQLADRTQVFLYVQSKTGIVYVVVNKTVYKFEDKDPKRGLSFFWYMEETPPEAVYYDVKFHLWERTDDDFNYSKLKKRDAAIRRRDLIYEAALPNGAQYQIYSSIPYQLKSQYQANFLLVIENFTMRFSVAWWLFSFEKSLLTGELLKLRPELLGHSLPEYNLEKYTPRRARFVRDSSLLGHFDMPDGETADMYKHNKFNRIYLRYLDFIYTFKTQEECEAVCKALAQPVSITPIIEGEPERQARIEKIRRRLEAQINSSGLFEPSETTVDSLLTELSQ